MRAHAAALSILEIPVGRGDDALAGQDLLATAARAHRTARLAPEKSGVGEDIAQTLLLRLPRDGARARYDDSLHMSGNLAPHGDPPSAFDVLEPRVGAGADEDAIDPGAGELDARG